MYSYVIVAVSYEPAWEDSQVGGLEDQLKGNAKKVEGDLTGDEAKQAEGRAQGAVGDAEKRAKGLEDDARDLKDKL